MPAKFARSIAKKIFGLRIPGNRVHRALAFERQLRHFAFDELFRIFYYQPMFESVCKRVGKNTRLELTPDSKVPPIINVDLELGERVRVNARTTFSGARNAPEKPRITIGDDSYVGGRVVIRAGTEVNIGKHVLIASNALISGDPGHPFDAVERRSQPAPAETLTKITIGDDVWLAYNVTVLGKVTIGEGSIVAAGSVVTKDIPPYSLVAGNPARVIRSLKGGAEIVEIPNAAPQVTSVPNQLRVGKQDRSTVRQALKGYYVDLFSNAGAKPDEGELEAVVDRAFSELDKLEAAQRATATKDPRGESDASTPESNQVQP